MLRRTFIVGSVASGVLAGTTTAQPQQRQIRWESAIAAFERHDGRHPPPADAVLFVGSSSIRRWRTLAADIAPWPVINRGFGGATMRDILDHQARIVLPYRPAAIVLYGGENDIVAGDAPDLVAARVAAFVDRNKAALGPVPHLLLTSKIAPVRARFRAELDAFNRRLRDEHSGGTCATVLDTGAAVADASGNPIETLFAADRLHLNADGYARWADMILPELAGLS